MSNAGVTLLTAAVCLVATATTAAVFQTATLQVYFGSLGAYEIDARGSGNPRDEFQRARIVEGMDFLAITSRTPATPLSAIAASLNGSLVDRFVALCGWQFGTHGRGSHVVVLEPSDRGTGIPDGDFDQLYRSWLPQRTDTTGQSPLVQFAEPRDPRMDYGGLDLGSLDGLQSVTSAYVTTIQIAGRSHREVADVSASDTRAQGYLHYLNAGFRVAPTADWGGSWRPAGLEHRTAVLAPRLTKRDILDSIRARRVYATDDGTLAIRFSINGHPMGSIVPMEAGTSLRIELTISDPDEPQALYWLSLRRDTQGGALDAQRELAGTDFQGNGTVVFTQFRRGAGDEHFLVHVVQKGADGTDHVWTAPIWLVGATQSHVEADLRVRFTAPDGYRLQPSSDR